MSGWEILIIIKHFGKQMDPKLRTFSRTRSHKVCTFSGPQWAKGFFRDTGEHVNWILDLGS